MASVKGPISKRRGFHLVVPEQDPTVTFSKGVCWLMANGWSQRPDSIKHLLAEWRRYVIPSLRDLASRLKSEVAPKPIKVVILGEGVEAAKLRAVCTTLEEALPNSRTIVVLNGSDDLTFEHISGEIEQLRQFTCTYVDLSSGIHRMIGDSSEDDDVFIPSRDRKSGEQSRVKIEPERFAFFSETFELVCDAAARSPDRGQEVSDFLRGNTITWRELELELAAPRDVYLRLREQLDIKVQSTPVRLTHTPPRGSVCL